MLILIDRKNVPSKICPVENMSTLFTGLKSVQVKNVRPQYVLWSDDGVPLFLNKLVSQVQNIPQNFDKANTHFYLKVSSSNLCHNLISLTYLTPPPPPPTTTTATYCLDKNFSEIQNFWDAESWHMI